MPTLLSKPLSALKADPNQPRRHFDEADLRQLGESLRKRQIQPILVRPDGTIIAGERRYRAALLVGLTELMVIVTDRDMTDTDIRLVQLAENVHRADLSGFEKFTACDELLELNPEWQQKDLAEHLHLDPSMVTRLLSPAKCTQAWRDALRDGKVGISDCYAASKLQPSEQAGLLALKLSGASRDQLERAGKKKRASGSPVVRASKIKCQLSSGVSVVVSGEEMSLDEMIEALAEAGKEAKKARDQGLDARTFQAVMRDKAKAS